MKKERYPTIGTEYGRRKEIEQEAARLDSETKRIVAIIQALEARVATLERQVASL